MKKHIIKSISILSLFVLLSGSAINVSATGGTCSVPSCRPKCPGPWCTRLNVAAPAITPEVTKLSEPDRYEQELVFSELAEDSFGFGYFLVQWALNYLR